MSDEQWIITPQVDVPSSFRRHVDGGSGKTFPRISTVKVPTYDLEPFERRIFYGQARVVGTGAAVNQFTFRPGVRFPSFRINRMMVRGENTNAMIWDFVKIVTPANAWAINEALAVVASNTAYSWSPIVAQNAFASILTTGQTSRFISGPVDFWRSKQSDAEGEYFTVTSRAIGTNTEPTYLFFEAETIPNAAEYADAAVT